MGGTRILGAALLQLMLFTAVFANEVASTASTPKKQVFANEAASTASTPKKQGLKDAVIAAVTDSITTTPISSVVGLVERVGSRKVVRQERLDSIINNKGMFESLLVGAHAAYKTFVIIYTLSVSYILFLFYLFIILLNNSTDS